MRAGNAIETLAASLHRALLLDLDPVRYQHWTVQMKKDGIPREAAPWEERRPWEEEVKVVMFEQAWESTALGFGGVGGSAITSAYTVVVFGPCRDACVYVGGRLAYHVKRPNEAFMEALAARNMVGAGGYRGQYELASDGLVCD